jgi:putative Mn2+ efflux pump MntP
MKPGAPGSRFLTKKIARTITLCMLDFQRIARSACLVSKKGVYSPHIKEGRLGLGRIELLVIACGLSMDAFAVSLCKGLRMRRATFAQGCIIALSFGLFQAFMPIIGWALGVQFDHLFCAMSHWVAFFILAAVGAKMLWDTLHAGDGCPMQAFDRIHAKELFLLSIATSIDALAVGVSFSLLRVDILMASTTIGVVTFTLCLAAVAIGNRWGIRLQRRAGMAGGGILMLIAVRILLSGF